jgi:hypothetical protein
VQKLNAALLTSKSIMPTLEPAEPAPDYRHASAAFMLGHQCIIIGSPFLFPHADWLAVAAPLVAGALPLSLPLLPELPSAQRDIFLRGGAMGSGTGFAIALFALFVCQAGVLPLLASVLVALALWRRLPAGERRCCLHSGATGLAIGSTVALLAWAALEAVRGH